jgi:hypothetical protein
MKLLTKNLTAFFYMNQEMMPIQIVNAKILNLPYATSVVQKDLSIIKFRSGEVVSLGNLFNILKGTNKRERQLKKYQQKIPYLKKLKNILQKLFYY